MTERAEIAAPVSPLLVGAAALVAGATVAAAVLPSLTARWIGIARGCLGAKVGQSGAGAAALREAWGLAAITIGPPLVAALGVALCAGVLQALAGRRERPDPDRDGAAAPRSRGMGAGQALALLGLTSAAALVGLAGQQGAVATAVAAGPGPLLDAAGAMAARIVVGVGVVLLGAGMADHLLRRLRLRAAWRAARGERGSRDGEADPRVRQELRRRLRQAD